MNSATLHPVLSEATYVTVVLPVAVPKLYTYFVPEELVGIVQFGIRVEVQFGKSKLYSGLVVEVHHEMPQTHKPKPILSIIDDTAIITPHQLKLWKWLASYYCCTLGEVMSAALPAGLKLNSETSLMLNPIFDGDFSILNDKEYLIAEALTIQEEIKVSDVQKILEQKTVSAIIYKLLQKRVIFLKEELKTKYKPKKIACVQLKEPYLSNEESLQVAFEKVKNANRQEEALMAFLSIYKKQEFVRRQDIYKKAKVGSTVLKAMEKKGIFELYDKEISRLGVYEEELLIAPNLAEQQVEAIAAIQTAFKEKNVVLLHGVTGSGKTRVYIELIREVINSGGQVLYLVPEIALTAQITSRLEKLFGDQIAVFNSRINDNERVEVWKSVYEHKPLLLGARSSLFLPFRNLQLIIVDEEHDPSYKQVDPAPRYSARDTAVFMAHLHQAKVILGTATPSIESYQNTQLGKYALVEMPIRYGGSVLPEIVIVDKKKEYKEKKMQSHFTSVLIEELKALSERGEQAILFQNRRGHSPVISCTACGWHQECVNCDVSLTYHKFSDNLRCHYCGYQSAIPQHCPACGTTTLSLKGFGTEKIEDEIKIYLPEARTGRMDFDTVRTKNAHARIINDFEERRIDILVGTQMVTKGLDFDNVGIVGVLSADHLLQFPDFRASERAFQLMTQVSGRAGRKKKQGKVIIQTFDVTHPVITEISNNDFPNFFKREIKERHSFFYPPFYRLIQITLKHKKPRTLNEAGYFYAKFLKAKLGSRVVGPAVPSIPRVRTYYLLDVMIKMERNTKDSQRIKQLVMEAGQALKKKSGYSSVRVNVNVDPS